MGRSLSRSSKVWFFTAHLGYLFGICVDKNSEVWHRTPQIQRESCISRKIKCMPRVSSMCFQDLGSSLATLQVAKAVDFFGCLTGSAIEIADAEQAYTQADMKGDPTWVCLPPEARPSWWRNKFPNLRRPVRRLKKKRRSADIRMLGHTGNRSVTHMCKQWVSFLSVLNGHLVTITRSDR